MTLITIWLDSIDTEWSVAALDIGFDDQRLYDGVQPGETRRFSTKGSLIYRKLTALSELSIYMPSQYDDPGWCRCHDRMVVRRHKLLLYQDGGYAPSLKRIMVQIAAKLSECGLGDFKIQYFVSDCLAGLLGPGADANWPTGPGEHPRY